MHTVVTTGTAQGSLHDEVRELFERRGWGSSEPVGPPALVSELSGPLGPWLLCVQALEDTRVLLFFAVLPAVVPPARRPAMAEFLARANHGLTLGSFELDVEDGEVRAKVALPLGEPPLDEALVERCIQVCGRLVEAFLPAVDAVAAGAAPGVEAARLRAR